jgi:hypothetical protein
MMYQFLYRFVWYWNQFKILIGRPRDPEWLTRFVDMWRGAR